MINNIQNNNNALLGLSVAVKLPGSFAYLTPDALMNYCATRLRGLDGQIEEKMNKQQKANADQKMLSDIAEKMQFGNEDVDLGSPGGQQCLQNGLEALQKEMEAVQGSDPAMYESLKAMQKSLRDLKSGSGKVTQAQLKTAVSDPLAALQKNVNSGTELDMIQLQSLMSQRQSAVSTVTQMVQALGEQTKQIAGNIGH